MLTAHLYLAPSIRLSGAVPLDPQYALMVSIFRDGLVCCIVKWKYQEGKRHQIVLPYYRKANWIGHIFRRNCLLIQVIEGKIKGEMEVARRRGRRRRKLLDDLKDRRG